VKATNTYVMPGTVTTATPATAGFAGQYLTPATFTQSGGLCTNAVAGGVYVMGFNIADAPRYLRAVYLISTGTNSYATSALLIARRSTGTFP
jgi:hypothetical protein